MTPAPELEAFVADFHRHRLLDANRCVTLGVEARLDELPDPTRAAAADRVGSAERLLARAEELSRLELDFDQGLDLELASLTLEREIHDETYRFNGLTTAEQLPTAGDDIAEGIHMMFVNDPRPRDERLVNITARLEAVPDYLEALLGRLEAPVRRWVRVEVDKIEGLPDLFRGIEAWGRGFADLPRLRAARQRAEAALARYRRRLTELPTVDDLRVDADTARRVVALRGIDLDLEGLHRAAQAFMRENRATLGGLRGRLAAKYGLGSNATIADVHQHLHRAFAVASRGDDLGRVIRRYEEERDRILTFVEERRLFPIPGHQSMKILRTPSFLEPAIPAGAMMAPPPFRDGERVSLVYLTLSDDLLDEHTELSIPGMMIHEGIPGHHLHLASAGLHPSVVRRHVDAMEQAEGWTTMLEDYMLDVGYMGALTDEARFVGKMDIARLGARVAIDLFFMTGERGYLDLDLDGDGAGPSPSLVDPFEAAGELLAAVTGFTPGRVSAELDWYSIERGYPLSYLAGNRLVWGLKEDVRSFNVGRLEGEQLDRAFHRTFLEAGSMPVSYLRRVFRHVGLLPPDDDRSGLDPGRD